MIILQVFLNQSVQLLQGTTKMSENNMMQNIMLAKIQGDNSNPWRELVSVEFTEYLDSISTVKQETIGDNCDE